MFVNVVKGEDGRLWIRTSRQKTTIALNVPLLRQAEELLGKYKYKIRANANGTIFPRLSNQKMNSNLKERVTTLKTGGNGSFIIYKTSINIINILRQFVFL
jgi:hypothetical protein